jgi:uncharacterized protein (TIGR00730 family)
VGSDPRTITIREVGRSPAFACFRERGDRAGRRTAPRRGGRAIAGGAGERAATEDSVSPGEAGRDGAPCSACGGVAITGGTGAAVTGAGFAAADGTATCGRITAWEIVAAGGCGSASGRGNIGPSMNPPALAIAVPTTKVAKNMCRSRIGRLLQGRRAAGEPGTTVKSYRRPNLDASGDGVPHPAMSQIRTVCVYCGSGPGTDPAFVEAARGFGRNLAKKGVGLVYGGGSLGLMGALATSVLEHGGKVTGIIPDFLTGREQVLKRAQEVVVTRDMHERKRIMFERADAFVALPGGIGTLEELVEQLTWAQLGRHRKPIAVANIKGFWDPLLALLDHMRTLAFIRSELVVDFLVIDRVDDILPRLIAAAARAQPAVDADTAAVVERL